MVGWEEFRELFRGNVMKAVAPLGLLSCRIPSYHSQWREREADRKADTERQGRHRQREMKMSKSAVKSAFLAHQDLHVGASGGEGWGAERVKTEIKGGLLESSER